MVRNINCNIYEKGIMYTSSKLIQKYYHTHMSHRLAGIINQIDTTSQMAARILGADFTAFFYCGEDSNKFIPVAYQYGHHLNIKHLGEFERDWLQKAIYDLPKAASLVSLDEKSHPQAVQDAFGSRNGFSHRYHFPLFFEDKLHFVCLAYWFSPVEEISLETTTMLDLICRVATYSMANVNNLQMVENYSSRLSGLLPIFEIPLSEYSFDELFSEIMGHLCNITPNATVHLFARNVDTKRLVYKSTFNGIVPEESLIEHIISNIEEQFSGSFREDTKKYRCYNLKNISTTSFREIITLQIVPDDEHQYITAICNESERDFCQNDRELLSVYAVFAQTVLRNALLVKRLKQTNKLLEESSTRLANVETVAALADMTSGLAHDFNNLLGGIMGRVQLMQLRVTDEKVQTDLKKIEKLASEGAQTVRRIQEFTTVTSPKDLKPVNLNQVVQDTLSDESNDWKTLAEKKNIEVRSRYEVDDVVIDGDHHDLVVALHKLIENAVEHAPEDSIVDVRIVTEHKKIFISVHDTGPGIPDDIRTKIFYPFFSTKSVRGAGLGLAIVHGIVGRLGGKVTVQSDTETGTTFTIIFRQSTHIEDVSEITRKETTAEQLKILVVDDDSEVREVLKDMLSIDGHEVVDCPDGYKALEILENKSFDIVITDLGMPGISGLELAEEVHTKYPQLPIAMITGWGAQLDQHEAIMKGIRKVLAKPFHLKEIKALVQELVTTT